MTSNLLKSRTIVKASKIKSNIYFLPRQNAYFCPFFVFIHQITRKVKNNGKQKITRIQQNFHKSGSFTKCQSMGHNTLRL
jgi:hypothetical protein